ncbi:hypothetical protein CLOM_g19538, partial [Closterium sp. NIES-68]
LFWFGEKQQAAFAQLKIALTSSPVLRISEPDRPYEVITDASENLIGAVLLNPDFGDGLQPVAYVSRKLKGLEKNYTVHDKEILAIVHAFKTWRCYLTGADVTVRTDHKSLEFQRAQLNLNPRQIRWLDLLKSNFHYTIFYKWGANNIADALTRPTAHTVTILVAQTSPLLTGLFTHGYRVDTFFRSAIHQQHTTATRHYFTKRGTSRIWDCRPAPTETTPFSWSLTDLRKWRTSSPANIKLQLSKLPNCSSPTSSDCTDCPPPLYQTEARNSHRIYGATYTTNSAPNFSFPPPTTHRPTGRPNESTNLWSNSFKLPVLTHRHGRNPFRDWNSRIITRLAQQPINPHFSKITDRTPCDLPPGLPPEQPHDHKFELELGAQPTVRSQWRLSQPELMELRTQLNYLLEKKIIRPSTPPYATPILFTPKKDGGLQMSTDYQALNNITIKLRYPIPRADNLIDQLRGAMIYFFPILIYEVVTTRFVLPKLIFRRLHFELVMEIMRIQ